MASGLVRRCLRLSVMARELTQSPDRLQRRLGSGLGESARLSQDFALDHWQQQTHHRCRLDSRLPELQRRTPVVFRFLREIHRLAQPDDCERSTLVVQNSTLKLITLSFSCSTISRTYAPLLAAPRKAADAS